MRKVLCVAALVAAVCATIPGASLAASPVLQGATFDQTAKVLTVTWSLPAGVESHVLEASMNPALDSEGYFLIGSHHGYHGADIKGPTQLEQLEVSVAAGDDDRPWLD